MALKVYNFAAVWKTAWSSRGLYFNRMLSNCATGYQSCEKLTSAVRTSWSTRARLFCSRNTLLNLDPYNYKLQRHYTAGVLSSLWENIKLPPRLKYGKARLSRASLRLYLCCAELPDYVSMLHELELRDTFNSWFRLIELHMWMCIVRLSEEGREGKFMRDCVVELLWKDVDKRSRKLGELATHSSRAEGVKMIGEQFKSSLFAYDEGLMGDDHVLAGALWRNLFDKNCSDVAHLELMVEYVRKQVAHLDRLDSTELMTRGVMTFLPLYDTPEWTDRQKLILQQIAQRF